MVLTSKNYVDTKLIEKQDKEVKVVAMDKDDNNDYKYKEKDLIIPLLIHSKHNPDDTTGSDPFVPLGINQIDGQLTIRKNGVAEYYISEVHKIILGSSWLYGSWGHDSRQAFVQTITESGDRSGQQLVKYTKTNGDVWWGWKVTRTDEWMAGGEGIKFTGSYTFSDMEMDDFLEPIVYGGASEPCDEGWIPDTSSGIVRLSIIAYSNTKATTINGDLRANNITFMNEKINNLESLVKTQQEQINKLMLD